MSTRQELKGICAASCTPFKEGGKEVDENALKAHLDYLIEQEYILFLFVVVQENLLIFDLKKKRELLKFLQSILMAEQV